MHARMKEHMEEVKCPIPNAPFKDKKFISDDTCMAHDTLECRDVLKKLKIEPSAKGLTQEDLNAALDVIANNTYMNVNDTDNTLYSTNECVIPDSERTKLGFQNCKVGDMQMGSNPEDMEVLWTYKDGCVISESQLQNNLGDVLTHIDTSSKDRKKQIRANINTSVQELTDETGGLVTSFNNNTRDAKNLKSQAEGIRKEKADTDSRTRASSQMQKNYEGKTTTTSKDADNEQTKYNNMKKDCVISYDNSTWSSCSASCGGGTQTQTERVTQSAENGGNSCRSAQSRSRSCNTHACPNPWGGWNSSRISGVSCPTGATRFYFDGWVNGNSSDQARRACETCYGVGNCVHETGDCAGYGWRHRNNNSWSGTTFGYQSGCSGGNGRIWPYGWSYTTYGYWNNG
jgi:hypothetical protein